MRVSTILFLFILIVQNGFSQSDWEFQKNKEGIKVYYKEADDSNIKELKVICEVETTISAALAVLADAANYPEWVYRCKEGRTVGVETEELIYYYNLTDFPWPFTDRDFVMRCSTYQDPETLTVYSMSSTEPYMLPETEEVIRIKMTESNWIFKPLGNGKIEIEYYLKSDPGGSIPAWLINLALDVGPVKSLQKFIELVQKKEYQKILYPFIVEP